MKHSPQKKTLSPTTRDSGETRRKWFTLFHFPPRFIIKNKGRGEPYYIDRTIIYVYMIMLVSITAIILYNHGVNNNLYLTCNSTTYCSNPLYMMDCTHIPTSLWGHTSIDPIICTTPTLYPGFVYGTPPAVEVENAPFLLLLLTLLVGVLNHYLWNVGGEQTMKVKILVTPKTDKGLAAINQHFKELGFKEKMAARTMMVKQEQLPDGSLLFVIPTTVTLTNATWEGLADSTMKGNGAKPDDYTITVNTE